MKVQFENQSLEVVEVQDHRRWYMTVEQVAEAYGVDRTTVMKHLANHADELREGAEKGVTNIHTPGGVQQMAVLYREGVIKLGFFIRSKRAAAFRQFATDLIVGAMNQAGVVSAEDFSKFAQNLDNRLDHIDAICGGLRREVDELKDMLAILWSEREMEDIQREINLTKATLGLDGRAVVGKVRATLNVSKIYTEALSRQVINTLKNMRGEGLKVLP